jgi:hypothetical protein
MCAPVESGTGGDGADWQPRFCAIELRLGPATRQSESGRGISAYERVWRIHGLITRGMTGWLDLGYSLHLYELAGGHLCKQDGGCRYLRSLPRLTDNHTRSRALPRCLAQRASIAVGGKGVVDSNKASLEAVYIGQPHDI